MAGEESINWTSVISAVTAIIGAIISMCYARTAKEQAIILKEQTINQYVDNAFKLNTFAGLQYINSLTENKKMKQEIYKRCRKRKPTKYKFETFEAALKKEQKPTTKGF